MPLSDYELLQHRSGGADGMLYEARARSTGRVVDLIMLHGAKADPKRWPVARKRLRLAAMLDHPASVKICEWNLDDAGPFIVRERIDSLPLMDFLGSSVPVNPELALDVVKQLTSGLEAAHRIGLAHGQLSPRTVMFDSERRVRADFTGLHLGTSTIDSPIMRTCLAPEWRALEPARSPGDIYALGAILHWLLHGMSHDESPSAVPTVQNTDLATRNRLRQLADELRSVEPMQRPTADELLTRCLSIESSLNLSVTLESIVGDQSASPTREIPSKLGRFRLMERLGQGGMGTVFRAEDESDGTIVAIKVLNPDRIANPQSLKRFEKEARMLAAVRNPHVANLIEVNQQDGINFLAMEFVDGRTARDLIRDEGRIPEDRALTIIADVCRALIDAHLRLIVHRDIKPENILIEAASGAAKLSDFGLARPVTQSGSLDLTRENLIGTPLYMAPEQSQNEAVTPAVDVYSLGATLFHFLTGRPPFTADSPLGVLLMHANDPIPSPRTYEPSASDGVCRIVERCLAKSPLDRFAHAGELLDEIERLRRGELTTLMLHPVLPTDNESLIRYEFTWDLTASPEQLWPYVSNTERLNKAIGLSAVDFRTTQDAGRVRRYGKIRVSGVVSEWEEHPYEWIEARRMGVLREASVGPFRWFISSVELSPLDAGGTRLTHRVIVEPRGWFGRLVAAIEIGFKGRRALQRVYRRIDETIKQNNPIRDAFEDGRISSVSKRTIADRLRKLGEQGVSAPVIQSLSEYLQTTPAQELARIRPYALARRLKLDDSAVAAACLLACREGVLTLLWDLLCPICRIPSEMHHTLKSISEHGRCEACNLDYKLDFSNSVEAIFRIHPSLCPTELGVYCIGGPAHSPHVAAQVRIRAGERIELDMALAEGAYRLRGPQLPYAIDFQTVAEHGATRLDMSLRRPAASSKPRILQAGRQIITLTNDSTMELLVRIERTAPRSDAFTAARAASMALFREIFPSDTLSPGRLVSIARVTLLLTDLIGIDDLFRTQGDGPAFVRIDEHVRRWQETVEREGGAIVKAIRAGVLASFPDAMSAIRAAMAHRDESRIAVHQGPALAATINDRLDYFGAMVNDLLDMPAELSRTGVVVSSEVVADAAVAEWIESARITCEPLGKAIHLVGPFEKAK